MRDAQNSYQGTRVVGSRGLSPLLRHKGISPFIWGLVFGKPFSSYHRSGQIPQPCKGLTMILAMVKSLDGVGRMIINPLTLLGCNCLSTLSWPFDGDGCTVRTVRRVRAEITSRIQLKRSRLPRGNQVLVPVRSPNPRPKRSTKMRGSRLPSALFGARRLAFVSGLALNTLLR